MSNKIDRYVIEKPDEWFLSLSVSRVVIRDRLDNNKRICEFDTDDNKLNMKLAEYCLKRIEEK